jgi:hypothetical protein
VPSAKIRTPITLECEGGAKPHVFGITSPTAAPNPHQKESESADHEDALLPDRRIIRAGNDQRGRDTVSQLPSGSRTGRSVIGRPFAISETMQAELRKSDVFRPARERLEQLAREPRDDAWAKLAEFQVQDLIVADGNSIRNIECRTTVCAVEMVQVKRSTSSQLNSN